MALSGTARPVGIKRAIRAAMVEGVRNVFTNTYSGDDEFQSLHVVTDFPIDPTQYPSIIVRYIGERDLAAGVAHREMFPDPFGNERVWMHRRFEGQIEFTVLTLSTLDRDTLGDALHEMLAFGPLTTELGALLVRVYGSSTDPYDPMGLLFQLNMNTDEIDDGGENAQIAPWESEDAMVYSANYTMRVTGGYYNALPSVDLKFIQNANLFPYTQEDFTLGGSSQGDPSQWSYTFDWYDNDTVVGVGSVPQHADVKVTTPVNRTDVATGADSSKGIHRGTDVGHGVESLGNRKMTHTDVAQGIEFPTRIIHKASDPATGSDVSRVIHKGTDSATGVESRFFLFSRTDAAIGVDVSAVVHH